MKALGLWLKENAAKHIEALIIAGALVLFVRVYLQEHDARLRLDDAVKTLTAQQSANDKTATAKVVVLQKAAAAVRTAPEAKAALPTVAPAALSVQEDPADVDRVTVEAVPLYETLNLTAQNTVKLAACETDLTLEKQKTAALQKKPGFFARLGKAAKVVGCSAAGGYLGSFAGRNGAAIGAATGASACQMF